MPDWVRNTLTVLGPNIEIRTFENGILENNENYSILESYVLPPRRIDETTSLSIMAKIGYDVFFSPDAEGYRYALEFPWVNERGIETKEQLKAFLRKKYPECYEEGLKYNNNLIKFGYGDLDEWFRTNWGTNKIDLNLELKEHSPNYLIFEFDTAWAPPIAGLDHVVSLFPALTFYLIFTYDSVRDYQGFAYWKNGKMAFEGDGHGRRGSDDEAYVSDTEQIGKIDEEQ